MKRILSTATVGLSLLAATPAFAADGYVTGNVNLRAGPDSSYPSVAMLRTGTAVAIDGCVDGWSWCDVASGDSRGWVAGNFLQEEYEGRRVLVPSYGVQIGIPIVSFVFATYWDDHYRNRSWYGDRQRWSHVRPQYGPVNVHAGSQHSAQASHSSQTRTDVAARPSGPVASPSPRQERFSNANAPRRPVATKATPAAAGFGNQTKPTAHTSEPKAAAPKPLETHEQAQPMGIAAHPTAESKTQPKKIHENESESRNGKDKDKDKDKDKGKDKDQH